MTIICALHQAGETWIGADSRLTSGAGGIFPMAQMKWSIDGRRALGLAGSGRAYNLLAARVGAGLLRGTLDDIAGRLLETLREAGFVGDTKDSTAPCWGASLIYADPDGVWDIDQQLGFARALDGRLWARGSGMEYALGADHALRAFANPAFTPRVRIETAIAAAIENDTCCGGAVFVRLMGG